MALIPALAAQSNLELASWAVEFWANYGNNDEEYTMFKKQPLKVKYYEDYLDGEVEPKDLNVYESHGGNFSFVPLIQAVEIVLKYIFIHIDKNADFWDEDSINHVPAKLLRTKVVEMSNIIDNRNIKDWDTPIPELTPPLSKEELKSLVWIVGHMVLEHDPEEDQQVVRKRLAGVLNQRENHIPIERFNKVVNSKYSDTFLNHHNDGESVDYGIF